MVCPKVVRFTAPTVVLLAAVPALAIQNEPLGYDGTNPVIYDNDGCLESGFTDLEVMALASAGRINLRGIITTCSYGEWDRGNQPLPEAELIRERQEFIEKGRRSGFRNIPDCSAGPSVSLRRPASGRIEDTKPIDTPGSRLIVSEAKKASAAKPLVIVMGGQATAVADAWLLDNSIADKVLVAWAAGMESGSEMTSKNEYNMWIDPWAACVVLEKLRVVMFPGGSQMWADTPKSRLWELPDTEIRTTCYENRWDRGDTYSEPSTDWDAQPLHPFTRADYVTGTRRLKFSRWDGNYPVYVIDAGGRVLAAWSRSRAAATEEWWARAKDPAAWGPSLGQIAFPGTPWAVPGAVEAEHFDHGGTGRAYQDGTNNFGDFSMWNPVRCLEHPDIRGSGTAGGGYKIAYVQAGEWMEYTINVASAGAYTLEVRVSSAGAGGTFHVEFNGVDKTGAITVPDTGGWDFWRVVSRRVILDGGIQVMRLAMDTVGSTGAVGDFDGFRLVFSDPPPDAGEGLRGEYYNNMDFTDLALVRTDARIDFNWGSGSPDPSVGADTFSVRWTGQVRAQYSEVYTFTANTDDGVRLWINGELIIDQWHDRGPTESSGSISLQAGCWYPIRMEYYENGGGAAAQLFWSSPSTPKQLIPQDLLDSSSSPMVPGEEEDDEDESLRDRARCGHLGIEALLVLALLASLRPPTVDEIASRFR